MNRSGSLTLSSGVTTLLFAACSAAPTFDPGVTSKTATLSSEVSPSPLPAPSSISNPNDNCPSAGGIIRKTATITGEDWPGNAFDRNGADNDDYTLTFSGEFLVDAKKKLIGTSKAAELKVSYSKDLQKTPCAHKFTFQFRRCPNKESSIIGAVEMDTGRQATKVQSVSIPDAAYLDIKITTTNPQGGTKETNLYESLGSFFTFK